MAAAAPELESTASLLALARAGDARACDHLFRRYLPALRRWAHGRLPSRGRDLADTDDLVQVTLVRAFNRIGNFEPRRPGAFLAYLRQILVNLVREEIRRSQRKPRGQEPSDDLPDPGPSPVERAVGSEMLDRYERALARIPEAHREAIVLRVELGLSYEEMAEVLERPTANAARLLVSRGLVRLAKEMELDEHTE
ncbi:MAG: hypothetical protein A2Z17_06680 [Gammaproteobacteria bacterium RBG_16_66_13]|nr:MAG: hypothetical protein A2Z17_06680 [Gammaproteobacteria bacterium RBG_16_66_13]